MTPRPSLSRGLEAGADLAESMSKGRLPGPQPTRPSDILKNLGEMRFENKVGSLNEEILATMRQPNRTAMPKREQLRAEMAELKAAGPNTYQQIGKTADSLASTGRVITEGVTKGVVGAGKAASTLGTGLERAGYVARTAGRAIAPYESRAYASQGLQYAEEELPEYVRKLQERRKNAPRPFQ